MKQHYKKLSCRNDAYKYEDETEEEEETAQEKRLRLAKKYLKEIEEEGKKNSVKYLFLFILKEKK